MKNRKMKRFLALALAGVMAGSAIGISAGAANYVGDMDGDGVITAFDAQILAEANAGKRALDETQQESSFGASVLNILEFVFGKEAGNVGKEYIPGQISVYTAEDLQLMQQYPEKSYTLMADIDMQDAVWTPVVGFSGSFDGNGYTISNLTIEAADRMNLGFFGNTTGTSVVTDLALRNVTVNCSADNQYIGIIAGTSGGTMTGYTVTGAIHDERTSMPDGTSKIVVGAMFGRTMDGCGAHTGGTGITVTDDTGTHSVSGLCGDVKLYIQKDSETVLNKGQCGFKDGNGGAVSGQWRDSTVNASNESETMRARQDAAVNYMHEMATVAWQVPETLTYNAEYETGEHKQVYYPGVTYYGLPYNHRNGGLERFMSCVASTTDGVHMIQSDLGNSTIADDPMTGFATYMGNDCSSAVGWAWMQISPNKVTGDTETECAGGAFVVNTSTMVPTNQVVKGQDTDDNGNLVYTYAYTDASSGEVNTVRLYLVDGKLYHTDDSGNYVLGDPNGNEVATDDANLEPYMVTVVRDNQSVRGIYPVGDWTTDTYVTASGNLQNDEVVGDFAYSVPAYEEGVTEVSTADFLNCNTDQQMAEAYALTRKADGLVGASPTGHARLVTSYPMTIRNADGTINLNKSFLVCTEQGEGYFDFKDIIEPSEGFQASYSNWRINYRFSYYNLLGKDDDARLGTEDGNPASVGARYSKEVYIPITIRALRSEYVKAAYISEGAGKPVTGPATGKVYSNWRIESTTVTVMNGSGTELFKKTVYTGMAQDDQADDYNHGRCQTVILEDFYTDWFQENAAKQLKTGRTYYYRVEINLANGETLIVNQLSTNGHSGTDRDAFVYNG